VNRNFSKQICVIKTITVATATQIKNNMKKLIAMAITILITASIAAFASEKKPTFIISKQFNYQMSFSRIVVGNGIDLQLTECSDKIIVITGENVDVEKLEWKIKGDVLYLGCKKGSLRNKVKVKIDVAHLKEIIVKGKSTIHSVGALHSSNLYVYMAEDCFVSIKNIGQIFVINGFDTEVDIKRMVGEVVVSNW